MTDNHTINSSDANSSEVLKKKPVAVVLLSGGLDSATCAAQAIADGYRVIALSFDYGQRHERELSAAKAIVQALSIQNHHVVSVNLAQWGGSSLTDDNMDVPTEGVMGADVIPSTYVPGRNTVFIAIALSLAEAQNAEAIYLGINAVDYSGYPDCRPEYLAAFQNLATLSSKAGLEGHAPDLVAPLVMDSKADIVQRALRLGVPIEKTWSCYEGGPQPCGLCDACRIRDAALLRVGRDDLATPMGRAAKAAGVSPSRPPHSVVR
ncbi:MAG: 7-cyano-7-deazaguanine synthase QueC [Cyanobacteria bacterium P01_D01_bin.105]